MPTNFLLSAKGDPTKKVTPPVNQDPHQRFGNWTGSPNTKVNAEDLLRRGLVGADQLVNENQDTSSRDAIINKNQSDWKIAAMQNILSNAHKFGIRSPEALDANRNVLIGNSKWADAINNPQFAVVHPNWWQVTKGILKDQWDKEDAANKQSVAKK